MKVALTGARSVSIDGIRSFSLVDNEQKKDYTGSQVDGEELFDFLAKQLRLLPNVQRVLKLGCTFSFPCIQTGLRHARLVEWTKEFKTRDVVGHSIADLLQSALRKHSMGAIQATAIINDTVGTLLAAAYMNPRIDIGSICGTGHNTCYLEPHHPISGRPMIVNIESGGYNSISQTKYDHELDMESTNPGGQRLEKIVSGRYLGEIITRILRELSQRRVFPFSQCLCNPKVFSGGDIDVFVGLDSSDEQVAGTVQKRLDIRISEGQIRILKRISRAVADRSAFIVAATYAAVIRHIDPNLEREHCIAIDGALFEKMPGYSTSVESMLRSLLGGAARVGVTGSKDASGIGAAVAALMADVEQVSLNSA